MIFDVKQPGHKGVTTAHDERPKRKGGGLIGAPPEKKRDQDD